MFRFVGDYRLSHCAEVKKMLLRIFHIRVGYLNHFGFNKSEMKYRIYVVLSDIAEAGACILMSTQFA